MSVEEERGEEAKFGARYVLWALAAAFGLFVGGRLAELTGNYRINEVSIMVMCPATPIILFAGLLLGRLVFMPLQRMTRGKAADILTLCGVAMMATGAIYFLWVQICQGECGGSHFANLRADIRAECPPDCAQRDMSKFSLVGETLDRADFSGTNLEKAQLIGVSLAHANLSQANLTKAKLMYADLSGADLRGANFDQAYLDGANLRGALIDDNTRIDEQWLIVWKLQNNAAGDLDLRQASLQEADLSGLELSGLDLTEANMSMAKMDGVDLKEAMLARASLEHAFVRKADLTSADLKAADLTGAYLQASDLSGADLTDAKLKLVNLQGAKYTRETRWPAGFDPGANGAVLVRSS